MITVCFSPDLVMDPNRNRTAVAFDALGMVVGTAVMGKPEDNPQQGDLLDTAFRTDLTQAEIDKFLANPKGPMAASLLDKATTRIIYDLTAYWREPDPEKKPPAFAATLARETHVSDPVACRWLEDSGEPLLLRWFWPRDPEEDSGGTRAGSQA